MSKLISGASVVFGAAVWILLFIILGAGLGTAFIAGGCAVAAGVLAAGMVAGGQRLDAPLTNSGLVAGIATFVILEVVLSSIPMWVAVVSGLGVIGLYGIATAMIRVHRVEAKSAAAAAAASSRPAPDGSYANGHRREGRDLVGAR